MKDLKVKRPTIYVEGGLVSGLEGFKPGAKIDRIDYDIEGGDEEDLCKCVAGEGPHYHATYEINEKGQG